MAAPATLRLSPMYGRRLDIENCSLDQIRACTEFETSRTRNRIALVVVSGAVAALAIAFVLGLSAGTMAYVGPMWGLCGAYVGPM